MMKAKLDKKYIYRIYDNGGMSIDRYTVVLSNPALHCYEALNLSDNCDSPQGVSIFSTVHVGPHLGKKTYSHQLPENVQKHIRKRLV